MPLTRERAVKVRAAFHSLPEVASHGASRLEADASLPFVCKAQAEPEVWKRMSFEGMHNLDQVLRTSLL